jgi:hypothetical protein
VLAFRRPLFAVLWLLTCVMAGESYAQATDACDRGNGPVYYRYSSVNSDWIVGGFAHSGVISFSCKKCDSANTASGLLTSGPLDGSYINPDIESMRQLVSGQPVYFRLPFDKAELRGKPTSVRFSGFVGWQAKFDVLRYAAGEIERHDVIVVQAQDGCASIKIRIDATASGTDNPVSAVKNLIAAIGVTKIDPPIIVKPPEPFPKFDQFRLWLQSEH